MDNLKIFMEPDDQINLTRISVLRILLQNLRVSKETQIQKEILIHSINSEEPLFHGTAMMIMALQLRNKSCEVAINSVWVIEQFEKNIQPNPIVSIAALNLMAELIPTEQSQ